MEEEQYAVLGRPGNNLKMGLVGLPNVGKSSLFNLLSDLEVPAENRSFCTIDPNKAKVPVPDKRFDYLVKEWKPASEVAANLSIVDIAGLVAGAHEGKGLGNDFLSHIAEVDGLFHVVRAFRDKDVSHYEGTVDPVRDLEIISSEFRYKDIAQLEKTIVGLEKIVDRGMDKSKIVDLEFARKAMEVLKAGTDIRYHKWSIKEIDWLNTQLFLSAKPVVFLVNVAAKDFRLGKNKWFDPIKEWVDKNNPGSLIIPFSVSYEQQVKHNQVEENPELGKVRKSVLAKVITTGYHSLNLVHYFTVGEDEVRCWTIQKNTKAKKAAGVIHTDFEKGFQSADVYSFKDFKKLGSVEDVRAAGKLRAQGKAYIVEDGDIMFFKINAKKKK